MNNCPKCHRELPPAFDGGECPSCGVIFAKFFAVQAQKKEADHRLAAPKTQAEQRKQAETPKAKTSACRTCGGLVAVGAKVCPHCGQSKPAPKPPTQVTKKHLVIAGVVLFLFLAVASNQKSPPTVEDVVQRCARETGIDPTSSRPISMSDISAIDSCLNKYGIKTKR